MQVNFAVDKTEILPESQPQIEQILKLLNNNKDLNIAIYGHTDNTGTSQHNLELSKGRAKSVMQTLVSKGVNSRRLSFEGFGDTQPIATNDTEEGRAKNRRVELVKM